MYTSDHATHTDDQQGPGTGRAAGRTSLRERATLRDVDAVSGVVLVGFGAFVLQQSLQLSFELQGLPGPGFFPALLAGALVVLGAVLVLRRWWGPAVVAEDFALPSRQQVGRSLSLWLALMASALLVGPLGFPLAMLLLVATIMFVIERRRGLGAVLTIILVPLLAWLLFGELLQVPLPMGPFGS